MVVCHAARLCKSKRSCAFCSRAHSAAWRGATAHAARARLRERVRMGPLCQGAEFDGVMEGSRARLLVNLSRAAEMQGDCQGAQKPESGSVGGKRPRGCSGDGSWHVGKKERRRSDMLGAFRAEERFCHAFDRYRERRARAWLPGVAICQICGADCTTPNGLALRAGGPQFSVLENWVN